VVIADPRAVAAHWPDVRVRMLAELAQIVTEAPWTLSRTTHQRARDAGLDDDAILHAIALSAYFGHLNRIADAVAMPLDYQVKNEPPHADVTTPALAPAPSPLVGREAIELSRRPATAAALADWRGYIFKRDAPLSRRQRTLVARWVAVWLGDGGISPPDDLTANPLDEPLRQLAEVVTLAPWQLEDSSFAALRAQGFEDDALFDVCATASSAGMFSRIEVALVALGR
jgi:alkylhydroperoxidase family enzyme